MNGTRLSQIGGDAAPVIRPPRRTVDYIGQMAHLPSWHLPGSMGRYKADVGGVTIVHRSPGAPPMRPSSVTSIAPTSSASAT